VVRGGVTLAAFDTCAFEPRVRRRRGFQGCLDRQGGKRFSRQSRKSGKRLITLAVAVGTAENDTVWMQCGGHTCRQIPEYLDGEEVLFQNGPPTKNVARPS
jgi:muramoyltetrapeptide carboxypeptidase LdcA involved in peptidoglycan recycling